MTAEFIYRIPEWLLLLLAASLFLATVAVGERRGRARRDAVDGPARSHIGVLQGAVLGLVGPSSSTGGIRGPGSGQRPCAASGHGPVGPPWRVRSSSARGCARAPLRGLSGPRPCLSGTATGRIRSSWWIRPTARWVPHAARGIRPTTRRVRRAACRVCRPRWSIRRTTRRVRGGSSSGSGLSTAGCRVCASGSGV